jgi:tetratricopeptide (TPR) repeat protein
MSLPVMTGLIGLLYIVVFGGLSLFRREGLSTRFAIEALIVTGIAEFIIIVLAIPVHPVLFVLVLYLVTLRVRILVDLANMFAKRSDFTQADRIYSLAARLGPDMTNKLIVEVNRAIMLLQEDKLDESISAFTSILGEADKGYLGVKYEAALHFNLGVAYLRKSNHGLATIEFNSAIDTWPASLYAQRAQQALNRLHHRDTPPAEEDSNQS